MGEPKSHTPQQRRGLRHTVLHTCVSTYVNVHVCTTRRRWPEGASCSRAPGRPCVTPLASLPFQDYRLAGPPRRFALGSASASLPLASSQWRSPVARREQLSATCTRDKAILHSPGSPNSAKSRPRPLTEDRVHGAF